MKSRLDELVSAKKLSFYAFIKHKPEDDEAGKKEHFHLYCEPSKLLQTDDLREYLREFDPQIPDKPKGCLKWVSSKFEHWYMYSLHDKRYLASKGESRRFSYDETDFVSSDEDDFHNMVYSIDWLALSPYQDMINAQNQGLSWVEYFSFGRVPIAQIRSYQYAWDRLIDSRTFRGDHDNHAIDVDDNLELDTGELVVPVRHSIGEPELDIDYTDLDNPF